MSYIDYIPNKNYPEDKRTHLRRVITFTLNTSRGMFADWMLAETERPGFASQFEYYPDHPEWLTPSRLKIAQCWPTDGNEPERVYVTLERTRLREDGSVEMVIESVEGFTFQLAPLGPDRIRIEASCNDEHNEPLRVRFCKVLYRIAEDWPDSAPEIHPHIAEVYPELLPKHEPKKPPPKKPSGMQFRTWNGLLAMLQKRRNEESGPVAITTFDKTAKASGIKEPDTARKYLPDDLFDNWVIKTFKTPDDIVIGGKGKTGNSREN